MAEGQDGSFLNLAMTYLEHIDLATDEMAGRYVKTEIVDVIFATADGELTSLEGQNRYQAGDAVVTGSTASRWSVARSRFELKYAAIPPTRFGEDGRYQACPVPVLARQFGEAFTAFRCAGGDLLHGKAGDWLLQYAPGDFGIAERNRFAQVYRRIESA
jgi:hypothetical protein